MHSKERYCREHARFNWHSIYASLCKSRIRCLQNYAYVLLTFSVEVDVLF